MPLHRKLLAFLQYQFLKIKLRNSKNQFLRFFYQEIISQEKEFYDFKAIEKLRTALENSNVEIYPSALGAGSHKIDSTQKTTVGKIARATSISRNCGKILFRLRNYLQPEITFELGTGTGISTLYLFAGFKKGKLVTFEGHKPLAGVARTILGLSPLAQIHPTDVNQREQTQNYDIGLSHLAQDHATDLNQRGEQIYPADLTQTNKSSLQTQHPTSLKSVKPFKADSVSLIEGDIFENLKGELKKISTLNLLFIDADHSYESSLAFFNLCLPKINENSVFVFHDIHWSAQMEKAWKEIRKNPTVSLSLDLFEMGLVFFRGVLYSNPIISCNPQMANRGILTNQFSFL